MPSSENIVLITLSAEVLGAIGGAISSSLVENPIMKSALMAGTGFASYSLFQSVTGYGHFFSGGPNFKNIILDFISSEAIGLGIGYLGAKLFFPVATSDVLLEKYAMGGAIALPISVGTLYLTTKMLVAAAPLLGFEVATEQERLQYFERKTSPSLRT